MPVTKYLERAREAAALADTLTGDTQAKVLDIAETWRKIAVIEADEIAKEEAKKRSPTRPPTIRPDVNRRSKTRH